MTTAPVNETLYFVHEHVLSSALCLLPGRMDTPQARAPDTGGYRCRACGGRLTEADA